MFSENNYEKVLKTINIEQANRLGLLLMIPVFVIFTTIHIFLWKNSMLNYFHEDFTFVKILKDGLLFLIAFFIGIALHELIHGISFALFAKGGFKSVSFGILWHYLTPYCHCKEPLKIRHYIFGALTPSIILGLIPAIAGLIIGKYLITFFGIVFIVASIGDFMIVHLLWNEKSDDYAQDHISEAGCHVFRKK